MHLFDDGWEKLRETIFANQKKLGIMPPNAQLTPWPDGQDIYNGAKLPRWDSLSWEEKKLFIKQADVYAAYQAYADNEIGRVIQAVEDLGQLDNTLIIYISGDNGASAEGMVNGTPNEFTTFNGIEVPVKDQFLWYEFWGSERTFPHYSAAWAWAFDTPFKWMKQVPSHFGGTAQGMAISWPGHIGDPGDIRRQFHHVMGDGVGAIARVAIWTGINIDWSKRTGRLPRDFRRLARAYAPIPEFEVPKAAPNHSPGGALLTGGLSSSDRHSGAPTAGPACRFGCLDGTPRCSVVPS